MLIPCVLLALVAQRPCPQDRHPQTIEAVVRVVQDALLTRKPKALEPLLFDACDRAAGFELAFNDDLFGETWSEDDEQWALPTLLDSAREAAVWPPALRFGAPETHTVGRDRLTRVEVPIEDRPLALVITVERIASGYVLVDHPAIGVDDQHLVARQAAILGGYRDAARKGAGREYAERIQAEAGFIGFLRGRAAHAREKTTRGRQWNETLLALADLDWSRMTAPERSLIEDTAQLDPWLKQSWEAHYQLTRWAPAPTDDETCPPRAPKSIEEVEALVRKGLATRSMQPIGDALPRRICDLAELDAAYDSDTADATRAMFEDDGAGWRRFFSVRLQHAERLGIDFSKLPSRPGTDALGRIWPLPDGLGSVTLDFYQVPSGFWLRGMSVDWADNLGNAQIGLFEAFAEAIVAGPREKALERANAWHATNDLALRRAFAGTAPSDVDFSKVMDRVLAKIHAALGPLTPALWLRVGAAAPNPPDRFDQGEGWPVLMRSRTPDPVPNPPPDPSLDSWVGLIGPYPDDARDCRYARAALIVRIGLVPPAEQARFLVIWREVRWLLRARDAAEQDDKSEFGSAANKLCDVLRQQLPIPAAEPPWNAPATRHSYLLGTTGDATFQMKDGALRWGKPGKVPHLVITGSSSEDIDRTLLKNLAPLALGGKIVLELRVEWDAAEVLQCAFEQDPSRLLTVLGNKDAKLEEWFDFTAIEACVASGRHVPAIARANAELLRQGLTRPTMLLDGHIWRNDPADVPAAIFDLSGKLAGR